MVLSRLESATKPNEPTEVDQPTIESDDPIGDLLAELIPDETPVDRPTPPSEEPIDESPLVISVLRVVGRITMTLGVLLLLFAAFQVWGTGLAEAQAQDDLKARFEQQRAGGSVGEPERAVTRGASFETLEDAAVVGDPEPLVVDIGESNPPPVETTADESPAVTPAPGDEASAVPDLVIGDPVGVLAIPAIGVEKTVAEGTSRDVLRSGPGHYPSTPLPGETGNVAIAGHRTTHGAPFLDIDQLQPGDEITFETLDGTYIYRVEGHDDGEGSQVGHMIVSPDEVGVIADKGDARLTLTACHPKYSARQRIIVTAVLISGPPTAAPPEPETQALSSSVSQPTPVEPAAPALVDDPSLGEPSLGEEGSTELANRTAAESLGWQPRYVRPTAFWAVIAAVVAAVAVAGAQIWRRTPAYAMASPPLMLALFYCFSNLEKLIPAV